MIKTICALVLLGLVTYTLGKKVSAKLRAVKCMSCGRPIVEPVKREVGEKKWFFAVNTVQRRI
ncbi:MAG: hypothetical protein QMD78_03335 [Methanocellales archaeon]|nr:hypothetical protein [Methanocellales archaeon]